MPDADFTVRIAPDPAQADQAITVVADQVLTATPADVGKVVAVAADGSYELVVAGGGGTTITAQDAEPVGEADGHLWLDTDEVAGDHTHDSVLLAIKEYDPAGDTSTPTTSLTLVDVDAANLVVSFIAPASGNVIVRLTAAGSVGTAGHRLQWGLRAGAADVADSAMMATSISTGVVGVSRAKRFTGLTPGATYTWKWAHCNSSAAATVTTYYGNLFGPALMEVWSA